MVGAANSRDSLEAFLVAIEPSQPELLKEIRIRASRMTEAMDSEILASALEFTEWVKSAQLQEVISLSCCTEAST